MRLVTNPTSVTSPLSSKTHDGSLDKWFHPTCFISRKWCWSGVPKPRSTGDFDNCDNIRWEHQQEIKKMIEAMNGDCNGNWREIPTDDSSEDLEPPAKKMKNDCEDPMETKMKKQNEMMFNMYDELKTLPRKALRSLLWKNRQKVPRYKNDMLNALTDAMFFGALEPCKQCSGKLSYVSGLGYRCTGNLTNWTKCEEVTLDPPRVKFVIPRYLQDRSWVLQFYTARVRKRIVRVTAPSTPSSESSPDSSESSRSSSSGQFPTPMIVDVQKLGTQMLRVTRSGVVDPESGMEESAHVYERDGEMYTATLAKTCIQGKKNSYYRLQILDCEERNEYWLFRAWGRTGSTIGDTKLEIYPLETCIEKFEQLYFRQTGNEWSSRGQFVKNVDKMYPVDTDHGEQKCRRSDGDNKLESKLEEPVQVLMKLIFDIDTMKRVMIMYKLDLVKMPLGNLSENQLLKAYKILTTVRSELLRKTPDRTSIIDATNNFYTLVPHSCGLSNPPPFESEEDVMLKCDMISDLLHLAISYKLMNLDLDTKEPKCILDANYEKLNTHITVLDKSSEIYAIIRQYVKASSRNDTDLEIDEIFVVEREGEDRRYEPFKHMPNRKLLWHGSRAVNFPGILSRGLKIPLPGPCINGSMFGKGIYFADRVEKSANYCFADNDNPTGLLLLCEVALGNMYERTQAEYIEKLPEGKHSTIGHGESRPDPARSYTMEDGVEVPYGPSIQTHITDPLVLDYNEYIVYDVAQIKTKYLVQLNFNSLM